MNHIINKVFLHDFLFPPLLYDIHFELEHDVFKLREELMVILGDSMMMNEIVTFLGRYH